MPAKKSRFSRTRQVVVEREALAHVADAPLDLLGLVRHVEAEHAARARGRREQPAQHADRGRLARAVRAQEAEHLALLDRQRDVVDRDEGAERAREVDQLDGRASGSRRRGCARGTRPRATRARARGRSPRCRRGGARARARARRRADSRRKRSRSPNASRSCTARHRGELASRRRAGARRSARASPSPPAARIASGVSTPSTAPRDRQRDARAALGLVEVGGREQDRDPARGGSRRAGARSRAATPDRRRSSARRARSAPACG